MRKSRMLKSLSLLGFGYFLMALAPIIASADIKVAEGFEVHKIYDVPNKEQGSWVAITKHDDGRLITADQYGSIYYVTVNGNQAPKIEPLNLKIGGAHGLLWFKDRLFVSVCERKVVNAGVYVVIDSDGDGGLDKIELMKKLHGGGEHGPHGFVVSPDKEWIYYVCGNHTDVPEGIHHYAGTNKWAEDLLLPRQPDARGHARGRMAPGGWVARFKPDNSRWELYSQGYRNAYGIAFNQDGELFTFDADMEFDFGTPWYRPTRICHVTSGSEFGWRNGTGKWADYYLDSSPAVLDIGPGSPTGVVSGAGAAFPARYQKAIFALDWTFATIYAIHLRQEGATYLAEKEEFVSREGLSVTDAVIGQDGAFYFMTGGRKTQSALYRVSYVGKEFCEPVGVSEAGELIKLRRRLEAMHTDIDTENLEFIWEHLGHSDRAIRYAARVALEHLPINVWQQKVIAETNPASLCQGAVALAHQGGKENVASLLQALAKVDFANLGRHGKLELLRAVSLVISRCGEGGQRDLLLAAFDGHYPADDDMVNRELCRLLSYLQSSTVVEKTLGLMASRGADTPPDWASLAARNSGYGKDVINMLNNLPSTQKLHYAYCLRVVKGPWTEGQRKQYFTWFDEASQKSGGKSFAGFIQNIRKEALSNATKEEQKMINALKPVATKNPFANLPQAKGPGKAWTVEDVAALKGLDQVDLENGRRMFEASLCLACHQVSGQGGGAGPDLTRMASRFQLVDMAEAIIEPNKVISDQFQFSVITKTDGSFVTGKVVNEHNGVLEVAISPFDFSQTMELPEDQVKSIKPSQVSPMPPALINRLNEKELRDLMGYLMTLK
ncbi:MAG: c-type cytochrome [Akkermansiaceae bacterium]